LSGYQQRVSVFLLPITYGLSAVPDHFPGDISQAMSWKVNGAAIVAATGNSVQVHSTNWQRDPAL